MVRIFTAVFALLGTLAFAGSPALADAAPANPDGPPAHPALWHVKGPHGGQVTLFGSLHMLPANTDWLRPDIWHAIAHTDIFVFEVATDPNLAIAAFSDLLNQFYPLLG